MNVLRLKNCNCTSQKFNGSALLPVAVVLACFAISPMAKAVVPAPDGGYPRGNTAEGQKALLNLTTGEFNSALGFLSLSALTAGNFCTGVGAGALLLNTADRNTAVGAAALLSNTIGSGNTATGLSALGNNMDGIRNTANGVYALNHNISGGGNTAVGYQALANNTADGNTAIGNDSLVSNTSGTSNTANGVFALNQNISGGRNTANGASALASNTSSYDNTAVGANALSSNTAGGNTAIGARALSNNTTGFSNTALGVGVGAGVSTASNVICIGAGVSGADVTNSCFIGNIHGVTTAIADAIPVLIDSAGQLGTMSSSRRFKHEIKPMDKASEAILAFKPVTFHYKSDETDRPEFGLIAEEVAEVNPDLVVRDENGEIYTVRYDAVNAMLLNEFLKEHRRVVEQNGKLENQARKIQEQETTMTQLKKEMETVIARLREHDSKIEKVSEQVQMSKPAPQMASNNH